jgi:hypothetical protein
MIAEIYRLRAHVSTLRLVLRGETSEIDPKELCAALGVPHKYNPQYDEIEGEVENFPVQRLWTKFGALTWTDNDFEEKAAINQVLLEFFRRHHE